MAASTIAKFLCSAPGLRYSTRVSSTPALPTIARPGSISSARGTVRRARRAREHLALIRPGGGRRFVAVADAEAAAEIEVVQRDAGGSDSFDQANTRSRASTNGRAR